MMKIIPDLILIAFFAVLAASVIYLARKFTWILGLESARFFYILFSFIPVYFLTTGIVFINSTCPIGHLLYKLAAILMGVYLFLILSLILVDLVNLFVKLKPGVFGIALAILTLLISIYGYWNGTNIRNTKLEVSVNGLFEEIKAVHLTDIHIGHFRTNGFLNKIIEETNEIDPDVIFLTGDYLDSKYALDIKFFEPLKQLKAPVYFVDGNHDHATNADSILSLMRYVGVNVLKNELANFKGLQVAGLTHMIADRKSFDMHASEHNPTIEETLPKLNIKKNEPAILLHHSPNGIEYANKEGIDLYLAGHTHAGQIFPFSLFANLVFDYNRGLHEYKDTKIFVSEGIGTFGPPFRIGTKSEIVEIKLIPEESNKQ